MLDRRRFTALTLATTAAPFFPSSRAAASMSSANRAGEHFQWSHLGKSVHMAEGGGGNVLYIPGKGGAILIDTKNPGLADTLKREAESRGPSIGLTINTHHHGDHTGGNYAFTGPSRLVAQKNASARIESQMERYQSGLGSAIQQGATDEIKQEAERRLESLDSMEGAWMPSRTIAGDADALTEGARTITAHHVGNGHTDNDLILHLEDENLIHFGDLIFNGLHPYCDASANCSIKGWIASLQKGMDISDDDTIVVPGHGPVTSRVGIRAQIDYFEWLLENVNEQIDAGKSREEIIEMTFPFMEGLGFERIRPVAIGVAYDEITSGS